MLWIGKRFYKYTLVDSKELQNFSKWWIEFFPIGVTKNNIIGLSIFIPDETNLMLWMSNAFLSNICCCIFCSLNVICTWSQRESLIMIDQWADKNLLDTIIYFTTRLTQHVPFNISNVISRIPQFTTLSGNAK